jgi:hypothetical protein
MNCKRFLSLYIISQRTVIGLISYLMKVFLTFFFVFLISITGVYGQREEIEKKLREYEIPGDYIVNALKDGEAEYYFKFKSVRWLPTGNGMEEIVEEGEFNPANPIGEKWKMLKINGNVPDEKALKKFNKAQNTVKNNVNAEIDDAHYTIVEDNENELIISLKYNKKTLPKRYKFLNECTGLAHIDKNLKRLVKIEYKNDNPVKVWHYKATGLALVQQYIYNEEENKYFIAHEEMDITSNYMGKGITILFDIDYSDYKKAK